MGGRRGGGDGKLDQGIASGRWASGDEAAKRQADETEAVAKRINDHKGKSIEELRKLLKHKGENNEFKKDETA